jgi:putative membrane protein
MSVSAQDRQRISAAIRAAEAGTSGEIVCVLAQTSSDATGLPILLAATAALAFPWMLVAVTAMPVTRILLLQIILFVALAVTLCLPRMRVALVPRAMRRATAHRAAMEQFMIRGIARKKDRTGILVFVSLAERYARIIADEGIAARVHQGMARRRRRARHAHERRTHRRRIYSRDRSVRTRARVPLPAFRGEPRRIAGPDFPDLMSRNPGLAPNPPGAEKIQSECELDHIHCGSEPLTLSRRHVRMTPYRVEGFRWRSEVLRTSRY